MGRAQGKTAGACGTATRGSRRVGNKGAGQTTYRCGDVEHVVQAGQTHEEAWRAMLAAQDASPPGLNNGIITIRAAIPVLPDTVKRRNQ